MAPREGASTALSVLSQEICACRACPRLVDYGAQVAQEKRAAFRDQTYWGRPVPGFGDPEAWLLIVGLAPAAHGAHRTGRMFTGDRSGDFLYAALHRAGLANQAESVSREDGLQLRGVYIAAAARCAPPDNKPARAELDRCRPFLARELQLLTSVRAVLTLGRIGHEAACAVLNRGARQRPFVHGAVYDDASPAVVCSYHVSQQNTFTGRLMPEMFDAVLAACRRAAGIV